MNNLHVGSAVGQVIDLLLLGSMGKNDAQCSRRAGHGDTASGGVILFL